MSLLVTCLISACNKSPSSQANAIPYSVSRSGAAVAGDSLLIFFISDSNNVIKLALPIAEAKDTRVRIGKGGSARATLNTGPNVLDQIGLPGEIRPPPENPRIFTHHPAIAGQVTYSHKYVENFKGNPVKVSIDYVDFGNGLVYSIAETELKAWPPPP